MTFMLMRRLDYWQWTFESSEEAAADLTNDQLIQLTNDAGVQLTTG